ncbi:MAG TPA: ATP-binding protein [Phycisphaerales bacterium]|nr:ATP-binding protein [Phycisphaerales bacterium]
MSLQARFAMLLALLGVAVVANLALSVWSVGLLDREQRWANEQIGTVLGPLHSINRSVWGASELLGSPGIGWFDATPPGAPDAAVRSPEAVLDFRELLHEAVGSIDALEEVPTSALRSGVNTTRNLRERLHAAQSAANAWFEGGVEADRLAALNGLYELHELIERLEARLIQDAQFASRYAADVRRRLTYAVLAMVGVVAAFLIVAAWLFQRWVLVKADRLRDAAERLGAGHFEHRIPIDGDDELDRVALRVNEMAGTILTMQAERIERERLAAIGEMARRVAHNIRNPLAGIRSLAELSALESAPDTAVAEHQQRIIRTVDRFGTWLSELLSVSTPLEVSLRPEPVRPWMRDLVEALRPMAEDRGVMLRLDDEGAPEEAPIDRRHLEQAVSAIVTNAIEISPRGGLVAVTVRSSPPAVWELIVEDEGPGISPQAQQQLFRPYFTTKQGGTGIGLAIAHRVVREHGGRLEAENRRERPAGGAGSGRGAVFRMELPLAAAEAVARIGQK